MSEKTTKFNWRRFVFGGGSGLGVIMFFGLFSALIFVPYVVQFEGRNDPERQSIGRSKYGLLKYGLPYWKFFEGLEYSLYDSYFQQEDIPSVEMTKRIAIVEIDQDSLDTLQQWPWPRRWHARLINRLKAAGAKVISLDVDFSAYQNPGPNGQLSKDDVELIKAVQNAKNVILPSQQGMTENTNFGANVLKGTKDGKEAKYVSNVFHLITPFVENDQTGQPGLDEATPDIALNIQPTDIDNGTRRYPLLGRIEGSNVGSVAALTCAIYQNLQVGDEDSYYETLLKKRQWFSLKQGLNDVPVRNGRYANPSQPQFQFFLMKYREPYLFPTYSYSKILNDYDMPRLKRLFNGKMVFVGATAEILKDWFPTPNGTHVNGVELHAGAACQLLENSFIEPPQLTNTLINIFGLSLVSVLWPQLVRPRVSRFARRAQDRWNKRKMFKRLRIRVQDTVWFLLTASLAILPIIGFFCFCSFSFAQRNTWVVGSYPMMAASMAASLTMVYLFTLENAERRKVMNQVGLYLDPDIMETILAHPEEDYPRPRRTLATVMFTDLQGFTPYSETHSAEEVVSALNAYMSLLHPIIKKYNGSVDKYIGDAIMAYFGVPVPRPDHATQALLCALKIQEANAHFRAQTGIPFYTRIGIHTGELIAGSVGSRTPGASLIAYTVIGDTVNLASRLEAKNKDFGSWILCSRATIDAAAEEIANIESVKATVKGKSQEVEMFIVRGPWGDEPHDAIWGAEMKAETKIVEAEAEANVEADADINAETIVDVAA